MSGDYTMSSVDAAMMTSFNLMAIIRDANPVVQIVILILLLASMYSWSVVIQSFLAIKAQKKRIGLLNLILSSGKLSADELQNRVNDLRINGLCIATNMLNGAINSLKRGPVERQPLEQGMRLEVERSLFVQEKSLVSLANISSIAPFIGLFGTIVGIMHSFNSIFAVQTVSLRIIAPSISEALFATAMGIFVAVPAGIFYNKLVNESRYLRSEAETLIHLFSKNYC